MTDVDGFAHQPGRHCGAAALRNVADFYEWRYSEAACFGIGGGPAFVLYDHPTAAWSTVRTSSTWLERAFFERLGIAHRYQSGDDVESAWANVTGHVDDGDPVVLFLDPAELDYLDADQTHLPPHVAVLVGYDDESVVLSDGAVADRQTVSRSTLDAAWTATAPVALERAYLVVTRAVRTEDGTDAAAAGLRQAATYMLEPLDIKRDARRPGEEGLAALRSFAEQFDTWSELARPTHPVRLTRRSLDEHGEGAAFRALYAEALGELGRRTGLPQSIADRSAAIGRTWATVVGNLDDILAQAEPRTAAFAEVAGTLGAIADREERLFADIGSELGGFDP